jgi:hypothetical protein
MLIHEVKCDYCKIKAPLKYNGEHWLVPKDWMQGFDDEKAVTLDLHVCPKCKPKPSKRKSPAASDKGE